jgi:hypothetical protein
MKKHAVEKMARYSVTEKKNPAEKQFTGFYGAVATEPPLVSLPRGARKSDTVRAKKFHQARPCENHDAGAREKLAVREALREPVTRGVGKIWSGAASIRRGSSLLNQSNEGL